MRQRARPLLASVGGIVLCLALAPAALAASCPTTMNAKAFASAAQLRSLVKQENRFGERYLASRAHNKTIGWIKDELRAIEGFKVRSDPFKVWTWLPRAKAKSRPGSTLERAGALTRDCRGDQDGAGRRCGPLVQADREEGPAGPARLPRPRTRTSRPRTLRAR